MTEYDHKSYHCGASPLSVSRREQRIPADWSKQSRRLELSQSSPLQPAVTLTADKWIISPPPSSCRARISYALDTFTGRIQNHIFIYEKWETSNSSSSRSSSRGSRERGNESVQTLPQMPQRSPGRSLEISRRNYFQNEFKLCIAQW